MSGESLGIPGLLYVGVSPEHELAALQVGPSVGWIALKGLGTWSREISVVLKSDLTPALCGKLGVALPEAKAEAAKLPQATRAAKASTLVAVESSVADKLPADSVRIHTIGSDRITGGFYYFAKGGGAAPLRVQGNLIEMIAPTLSATADNAAMEASLDGLIGRVIGELSDGVLSEAQLELAEALPSLGEPEGDAVAKLQTLEGYLVLAGTRASKYEERARSVVEAVGQATRQGKDVVSLALFGDAQRVVQPELEIEYAEGEAGDRKKLTLPERSRWLVSGLIKETVPPPAVAPVVDAAKVAAEKAAAEKAAAERAAAAKAEAEKEAAQKAAAQKFAAERAAVEKAAADKVAAEKAAAQKAAAEKAAADKAAAEKAAAEKAVAEKLAAEKAAAEKAAAEKAVAEKAAAEKVAAEKAAADKAAAEKAAAEKAAAEEAASAKAAEKAEKTDKAAKPAKDKPAAKAASTKKKAAAEASRSRDRDEESEPPAKKAIEPAKGGTPAWLWLVLVIGAVAGAYYYFVLLRHR